MVHLPAQQPLGGRHTSPILLLSTLRRAMASLLFQAEVHPSYPLEPLAEHTGKKSADYTHTKDQAYPGYSETSGLPSKNLLPKFPLGEHQVNRYSSEQVVQEDFTSASTGPLQSLPGTVVPVRIQTHVPSYGSVMYTSISQMLWQNSSAIVICKVDENVTQRTLGNQMRHARDRI